ncbi:MAG: hypothetical protein ACXWTY_06755 [Methylobacter sp.]
MGVFHYYNAETSNDPKEQLFCLPEPKPTHNGTIAMFVAWALEHPQFMNEIPVETEFRFLTEKYPCKK